MKGTKLVANIVLSVVVMGLGYYLYKIIQEPIIFQKEKDRRFDVTIEKLKDIRQAELAYKDLKGKFANNFGDLVRTIKHDSFPVIKAIGEAPDSITEAQAVAQGIITRDTTYVPMLTRVFPKGYPIDSLPYIPFSGGKIFTINAGEIEKNKVTIQVFEVSAPDPLILSGLDPNYIDDNHSLTVGSMTEGTYTGNWE